MEKQPMDITTPPLASIGIDIGKEVFHVVGFGADGKIAFRRKIKRLALVETLKKISPCVRIPIKATTRADKSRAAASLPEFLLHARNGHALDQINRSSLHLKMRVILEYLSNGID
jgi:hypothetical protein